MYRTVPFIFNVIGVIFEIVAIGWAARMISYNFKKWTLQNAKHASRSDEEHFNEEKKQEAIILFLSLGVLFQGITTFF